MLLKPLNLLPVAGWPLEGIDMSGKSVLVSILLMTGVCLTTSGYAQESAGEAYASLEDFCLKTRADTPENCACGQATADELLSEEEQTVALNMMGQQSPPGFESLAAQEAFMDKLRQVTNGCGGNNQ